MENSEKYLVKTPNKKSHSNHHKEETDEDFDIKNIHNDIEFDNEKVKFFFVYFIVCF